jgi:hypothetical protein
VEREKKYLGAPNRLLSDGHHAAAASIFSRKLLLLLPPNKIHPGRTEKSGTGQ